MLMIGIPVDSTLIKFNLGALLHSIGEKLPNEWIPDTNNPYENSTVLFTAAEKRQAKASSIKNYALNGILKIVKELDVLVFWSPPTHLISRHCLVWCQSNILFYIPRKATN
ncbi:hypothetical protein DSO57_1007163 [Entomophthora muscae]|uniref:Uncharacterized protein n=1 Tax=Entomophthora muscae TaxID=34485 RepID=A0ACC2U5R5_9FUNG|nr:hypothetical protein DSO57_1007163 [Entomophthora muscae]